MTSTARPAAVVVAIYELIVTTSGTGAGSYAAAEAANAAAVL